MIWRSPVYDWQKEYHAWAQSRPRSPDASRMYTAAEYARLYPPARLSDVLTVTREILGRPEIREQFEEFVRRSSESEIDEEEDEQYAWACQPTHDYYMWFRMKRRLDDHTCPYHGIPTLLNSIVRGDIGSTDIRAIRLNFQNTLYLIDDVSMSFGRKI